MITGDEALYWAKKLLGEQGEDIVKKINNVIQMVTDLAVLTSSRVVYYGTSSTAAGTQTKNVSIPEITSLYNGLHVRVLFSNAQTYNGNPNLEINDLGAKAIRMRSGTNAARYEWNAGAVIDFVYNDSYFLMSSRDHATTSYFGVTKLYSGAGSTSTSLALTPNSLYLFGNSSVCPYFDSSSTYAVGDRVRYAYYIYECNTAITTPESWTAAHWTQLPTLQEQVDDKVDVDNLNLFDVVTPSFSSLPKTFYSTKLTSSCKLVGNAIELSTPKAGDIDWSVSFANGSLTISGTFHGSTATTAKMSVWLPTETITLTNS